MGCDVQPLVGDEQPSGQLVLLQLELPVHVRSHAHELAQSTWAHELCPPHEMLQRPSPHLTLSHEPVPVHCTVHEVAFEQSTSLHALVAQLIVQFQPLGQATLLPPVIVQAFWLTSHDVHALGHVLLPLPVDTIQ